MTENGDWIGVMKMNESDNKSKSSGMGCVGFFSALLGVAFIVLKLIGVIDWSWWWVLAPLWIPAAIIVILVIAILIIEVATEMK